MSPARRTSKPLQESSWASRPRPRSTIPTELFVARAREEVCAGTRNRLFVIDGKQVFWDRAGNCGDNSYAQRLYGATPDVLLCSAGRFDRRPARQLRRPGLARRCSTPS